MYFTSRVFFPLFVTCCIAACSQPALKEQVSEEFASENLYPVQNSGFAEAFARRDVTLSSYLNVDIQPLEVSRIELPTSAVAGTLRRNWLMTRQRETALQTSWADAMDRAFSAFTGATGGQGVLRITAELTRVAPSTATATTMGRELQPAGSTQDAVEISAEFRLFDDENDELLAVIRDSRTITAVAMSRTAPVAVTSLFRSWAALLHTRVSGR